MNVNGTIRIPVRRLAAPEPLITTLMASDLASTPAKAKFVDVWTHDDSKTSEPYHTRSASLPRNLAAEIPNKAPSTAHSTLLTTSLADRVPPFDALPPDDFSTGPSCARPPAAPRDVHSSPTWCQAGCHPEEEAEARAALAQYLNFTPSTSPAQSVDSRSTPVREPGEHQDPHVIAKLCSSSVLEQDTAWQQFSPNQPATNHPDNTQDCNCTQGHAYRSCDRFKEHYWTWLGEGAINGDFCSCPPRGEELLALECTKLEEHIRGAFHPERLRLGSTTGVTGTCSCPNTGHYISTQCALYEQHLMIALKGKARSRPAEPFSCSCAKHPSLVSRSCQPCINGILAPEMQWLNKMYEPSTNGREWDFEGLMNSASAIFGSNPEHSGTTDNQGLQDTSRLEDHNEAVPVSSLGQNSTEGQGHHPQTLPSSIAETSRDPCQPRQPQSSHRGRNRRSTRLSVPSSVDDDTSLVVTGRIDGLSPHAGYNEGRLRSISSNKRTAPGRSPSPRPKKKRRIELPPKAPPDPEPSPSSPPARSSGEYKPSRGGKKPNGKPLSKMRDYYYRQNTSLDDQTYLDNVIEKLRDAPYLKYPQTCEPTVSSEAGKALMGDVRVEGPGRAREDESVYGILVDKPPTGPFRCWICGHLEKQRKPLRVLGHVREHFEHRPWECTHDHGTVQDEKCNSKRGRAKGQHGPCGKRFSYEEALVDHQAKGKKLYPCRLANCHRTFSTPSNRRKHECTQPHSAPA